MEISTMTMVTMLIQPQLVLTYLCE